MDQTSINTSNHLQTRRLVWERECGDEAIVNKTNKQGNSYRPDWCQSVASAFSGDGVGWLVGWFVGWLASPEFQSSP